MNEGQRRTTVSAFTIASRRLAWVFAFVCVSACGTSGGGGPPAPEITSMAPGVFYVSDTAIPFSIKGIWPSEGGAPVSVRFVAESGTPFRSATGAPSDTLDLPASMDKNGDVVGDLPPGTVTEATTARVQVTFATAAAVGSALPLGIFLFQRELPYPPPMVGGPTAYYPSDLSVSGDTVIAGAYNDYVEGVMTGSAHVFVRSGLTWSFQQALTAPDGLESDRFGWSVAVSGTTAIVGSQLASAAANHSGAVYVFVRYGTNSTWSLEAKLEAPDPQEYHLFGNSVAIDGNTVVVGAPSDTDNGFYAGAVYVYTRSGTVWTLQQKILAPDGATNDEFGYDVALDGDTLVAGARWSGAAASNGGAAYVFVRSATHWTVQAELTASDATADDRFGEGVAVSGNRIVVRTLPVTGGRAYAFVRGGSTWSEEQLLVPPVPASNDGWIGSVAIEGTRIALGVPFDDGHAPYAGAVHVYEHNGTSWVLRQTVHAVDGTEYDRFGVCCDLRDGRLIVGSDTHVHGGEQGALYAH